MADLNVNSIGDASGGNTATINGQTPTVSNMAGRNRIINGDMRIDQRNAGASQTVTTAGAYTVDRFFVQPNGASVTTQRVAGSGQYQNALRITGAASVTQCFVQQKIEALNSYDLAGQTVTVTIRASSSTLTSLTCYVERATAGTDNWATFATEKTQLLTITSTPTDYTFQATLSASATNGIRFIFATGAFTSGTLDITGVQLEAGSVATPFEHRMYGQELALCQRYYWKADCGSYCYTQMIADGKTWRFSSFATPSTMRAAPTISGIIGATSGTLTGNFNTSEGSTVDLITIRMDTTPASAWSKVYGFQASAEL